MFRYVLYNHIPYMEDKHGTGSLKHCMKMTVCYLLLSEQRSIHLSPSHRLHSFPIPLPLRRESKEEEKENRKCEGEETLPGPVRHELPGLRHGQADHQRPQDAHQGRVAYTRLIYEDPDGSWIRIHWIRIHWILDPDSLDPGSGFTGSWVRIHWILDPDSLDPGSGFTGSWIRIN
jgi:hypothetical protein